jgi:TonB family protein
VLRDAKGGTSTVTIADVRQSNGVIHVVNTVLMPAGQTLSAWRLEASAFAFHTSTGRTQIARLVGAVTNPERIGGAPPVYPEAASKLGLTGKVIIESFLDTEGRVRDPSVLHGLGSDNPAAFAAIALDTVCDWRFKPALLNGKPIQVYYTLTVNFGR